MNLMLAVQPMAVLLMLGMPLMLAVLLLILAQVIPVVGGPLQREPRVNWQMAAPVVVVSLVLVRQPVL